MLESSTNAYQDKINEIAPGLPSKTLDDGTLSKVTIVPFYDRTDLIQPRANNNPIGGYHHQVVFAVDRFECDHLAVALGRLDGDDTLATATLLTVFT